MTSNATFSSLLFIDECLLDEERTVALRLAIRRQVRPGDVVLDAGTGSGILALFAAEAGARKVYAVDIDPEAISLARHSTQMSPYADRIEVVEGDIEKFCTDRPVDVVIMEMLDTGMIAERQAPALQALRKHQVIGTQTRVIPQGVKCSVEGVEYDFNFYGFPMWITIQARNSGVEKRIKRVLTDRVIYREVDFRDDFSTMVEEHVVLTTLQSGVLNALKLRMQTILFKNLAIWETTDMNMPITIPIAPMGVDEGEQVRVSLRYQMGAGFNHFGVSVQKPERSAMHPISLTELPAVP